METKEAQAEAPEAAALKDLVDQCRFFHVSLAGTCLILLLAVSAGLSNPDANAYREISAVSTLTNKWNSGWLTGTVETTSKNKFEDLVVRKAKLRQLLLTYGPDHTYVTAQVETSWFLSADKTGDDKDRTSVTLEDFQNERGTTDIANLTDFIRTWDLLGSHPVLNSLEVIDGGSYYDGTSRYDLEEAADSSEYLNEKGINPQPISGSMYFFGAVLMNKPRALQLISQIEKIDPYSKKNVIYDQVRAEIGKARYDCFFLPSQKGWLFRKDFYLLNADCVDTPVALQKVFGSEVAPMPPAGSFDTAFPELSAVTKWIRASPIQNLEKHLYDQSVRAGDKLDVLGVKIPAEGVSSWGAIVFVGVLTMFWLNLDQLSRYSKGAREKCETVWIADYISSMARLVFFLSITLLPLMTAFGLARLGIKADRSWWHIFISTATLTITTLLLAATCKSISQFWDTSFRLLWQKIVPRYAGRS